MKDVEATTGVLQPKDQLLNSSSNSLSKTTARNTPKAPKSVKSEDRLRRITKVPFISSNHIKLNLGSINSFRIIFPGFKTRSKPADREVQELTEKTQKDPNHKILFKIKKNINLRRMMPTKLR